MALAGTSLLWYTLAFIFFGLAVGIVIGVVIDRDTVVNQIFKKIRYRKGTGDLIIEGNQQLPQKKTWKQRRAEKKAAKS